MSRRQQRTAAFLTSPVSPCLLFFPALHLKLHPSPLSESLPSFLKQTTTTCVPAKRAGTDQTCCSAGLVAQAAG